MPIRSCALTAVARIHDQGPHMLKKQSVAEHLLSWTNAYSLCTCSVQPPHLHSCISCYFQPNLLELEAKLNLPSFSIICQPGERSPLNQLRGAHMGSQRYKRQAQDLHRSALGPLHYIIAASFGGFVRLSTVGAGISMTLLFALGTLLLLLSCHV